MIQILIIGGHGKISQILTPLLLAKSWNVTSLIRTAEQKARIEDLCQGQSGRLSVLVKSIANVKKESDAKEILHEVNPDWVVFSAGAGGKGTAADTLAIDRDAAIAFAKASVHMPSVKKFLAVSYIASRRCRAPWWTDKDWEHAQKVNKALDTYYEAKITADEVLTVLSKERVETEIKSGLSASQHFSGISLRPGTLTEEKEGRVRVGKIGAVGKTSRASVAAAIVVALETQGVRGWIDILDGEDDIAMSIKKTTEEDLDSVEGEDFSQMQRTVSQFY